MKMMMMSKKINIGETNNYKDWLKRAGHKYPILLRHKVLLFFILTKIIHQLTTNIKAT